MNHFIHNSFYWQMYTDSELAKFQMQNKQYTLTICQEINTVTPFSFLQHMTQHKNCLINKSLQQLQP